jgi:hypothetical protein
VGVRFRMGGMECGSSMDISHRNKRIQLKFWLVGGRRNVGQASTK